MPRSLRPLVPGGFHHLVVESRPGAVSQAIVDVPDEWRRSSAAGAVWTAL